MSNLTSLAQQQTIANRYALLRRIAAAIRVQQLAKR